MKKISIFLAVVFGVTILFGTEVTVQPDNAQIVLSEECGGIAEFAAKDLQHHLKLITGKTVPIIEKPQKGKFTFLFTCPPGLKPEEARYEVTSQGVTFAGDDEKCSRGQLNAFDRRRTGSISALNAATASLSLRTAHKNVPSMKMPQA